MLIICATIQQPQETDYESPVGRDSNRKGEDREQ